MAITLPYFPSKERRNHEHRVATEAAFAPPLPGPHPGEARRNNDGSRDLCGRTNCGGTLAGVVRCAALGPAAGGEGGQTPS